EPATCRQISCLVSAQSRPMKAANSSVVNRVICPLQSIMIKSFRDRQSYVERTRYREPVKRQALSIRSSTQCTGGFENVVLSIACYEVRIRNQPVHVLISPRATSKVRTI